MKIHAKLLIAMISLTGCIRMTCMSPSCLGEETYNNLMHPKLYGAHWVKEGMTRESRLGDFVQCGGRADLREGYEMTQGQSNKDFFDGFKAHVYQVSNCMKSKGYTDLDKCDARCLYP